MSAPQAPTKVAVASDSPTSSPAGFTMAPKTIGPADGRSHRARQAIRKLMKLGLNEKEVIHLLRAFRASRRRPQRGSGTEPVIDLKADNEVRLRAAQDAIRTMMDLGFKEVDIA